LSRVLLVVSHNGLTPNAEYSLENNRELLYIVVPALVGQLVGFAARQWFQVFRQIRLVGRRGTFYQNRDHPDVALQGPGSFESNPVAGIVQAALPARPSW
jgi:hypothetical protein